MTSNGIIGINLWPSKNQLSGRDGRRGLIYIPLHYIGEYDIFYNNGEIIQE
jgi:hypothetical protein